MDFWTLPGADAFLEHIRAVALEQRENVILALPENAAPGMAEALKTKLDTASVRDTHHYSSDGRALDVILYEAAGVPATDPIAELMPHMCESRPVIIDAITADTALPSLLFLQEYANASRNLDKFNPLLVISIGLPWSALPQAPKLVLVPWNGWMSEADVLTFVVSRWRQRPFDRRSRLRAGIICELARWDIGLAERLMALAESDWDQLFDPDKILACLTGLDANGTRPRTWEAGGLARFDGDVGYHLCTFADGDERRNEVVHRLWAAQAAHLLPTLEKHRRMLIQAMHASGHLSFPLVFNGESIAELDSVELGGLMTLAQRYNLPKPLIRYADVLRHRRNDLAHLKPLSARDADTLLRMIAPLSQAEED